MATKTISLSEDAYEVLASLKEEDESFSDVVRRLARAHRDLSDFSGTFPEIGDVADELEDERETFATRPVDEL